MNLDRGCQHCKHLRIKGARLECTQNPNIQLKDAGACVIAFIGKVQIIAENCPDFDEGKTQFEEAK